MGQAALDHLPAVVALEAIDARHPSRAEAKIKAATLQLPNIQAAIHHIWKSVYKEYSTEEYGQAAVWTLAKKTIATFIITTSSNAEGTSTQYKRSKTK
jgi:hypothetical protein